MDNEELFLRRALRAVYDAEWARSKHEWQRAVQDAFGPTGTGVMQDGKRIDPKHVYRDDK